MTEAKIKKLFIDAGALMEGHFLLTSGLHSPQYVDKFKILTKPKLADPLMREMASRWADKGIDIVVGPAVGGIILSYEIAKHLGTEGIFLEREDGEMIFRRGFALEPGQRVLLVEDIVTTGGSIHEIHKKVIEQGAEVAGVALMVDRSGGKAKFEAETSALLNLDLEVYNSEDCPLCQGGVELKSLGRTGKKI